MGKLWEELPLSRVVKTFPRKPPGGTCKAQMGRAICPTPIGRTIQATPHPSGLFARKWGSFSLFPDSVITHPNFLTPQTHRGRLVSTQPGCQKHEPCGWEHSPLGKVGSGCGLPLCPGLLRNTGKEEAVLRTVICRSHQNVGQRFTLL